MYSGQPIVDLAVYNLHKWPILQLVDHCTRGIVNLPLVKHTFQHDKGGRVRKSSNLCCVIYEHPLMVVWFQ